MKKIRLFCLLLSAILALGCAAPSTRAEGADQSVTSGCHSPDAVSPLGESGKLVDTSKTVIIYELNSDTLIYAWNPDERIYPSSMVKLMTALLALEQGNLEDRVTVTKRALTSIAIGSVSAGLKAGEELTLQDLLYCMMTESANDAAAVIAEHIGGSQELFVNMMNRRAQELGCTGTNYTNPHGLHDENCYTTTRDILRLLDYALDNETFTEIFSATSYTLPATNKNEERVIHTSNYMMSTEVVKNQFDKRVTGGKTGTTDEGGRCLAATAEGGGMRLLTIVMGAEAEYEENGLAVKRFGSFEETGKLLDYALEKFEYRQIFLEGQTVSQYAVEGGTNSVVTRPAAAAATVLPVDLDESQLTWIRTDPTGPLTAPVQEGQALASLQLWYGAKCLAQVSLVAANAVEQWTESTVPTRPVEAQKQGGGWKILIWILVGIGVLIVGAVLVLLLRRAVRSASRNAMRRRRRADRRRSR